MSDKPVKIDWLDAVAIGFMAVVVRLGDPFISLLLEICGLLCGVAALWAMVHDHTLLPAGLTVTAWASWWLGRRLHQAISQKPLDEMSL